MIPVFRESGKALTKLSSVSLAITLAAAWTLSQGDGADEYIPTPIAGVEMTCHEEEEPIAWSFCVNRDPTSKSGDLLYYLHARNGNATWWNDRDYHTGRIYEAWKAQGEDPPTVVSVSFGELWMLSDYATDMEGGLLQVFTETVIPTVEERVGSAPARRMVAGISMGGFNTLLLAMKTEGVFTKAAAICSPFPMVSHHDGLRKVLASARETNTSLQRTLMLWQFSRRFYPTKEIWSANAPLVLSHSFSPATGPAIYLTCGRSDDWGCFTGSERFAATIERLGGEIEWVPREGGHCDVDYASVAAFLGHEGTPVGP